MIKEGFAIGKFLFIILSEERMMNKKMFCKKKDVLKISFD